MTVGDLPAVNASLNSICTVLLVAGFVFIKRERKKAHMICMIGALVVSAVFLGSYLFYHYEVGSVKFTHEGMARPIYFVILISHILLAMVLAPMVIVTVIPAIRERFDRHRKIARWTWPIWMYVSITGVIVYLMLYQWFPPTG
jgi:putative membrane protein